MAGGKLTPRQKMINLMYLVFIAMLALNMSKEVLSAFGILNNKITDSNGLLDSNNTDLFSQLGERATNQAGQYGSKYAKVQKIKEISDEFNTYIAGIKSKITKEYKPDADGNLPFEAMDKTSVVDELFFTGDRNTKAGDEFVNRIKKYLADVKSIAGSDLLEETKVKLDKRFSVAKVRSKKEGKDIDWLQYNYEGFPLIASVTKLTQLQNDIKVTENEIMSGMFLEGAKKAASLSAFEAIVVPDKTAFFSGETVTGKVILGKKDPNLRADAVVINGRTLDPASLKAGQAEFSFGAGNVGEQNITGEFRFKEGDSIIKLPIKGNYVVVPKPNSATISADKMNVVYRGVVNPMTISFAGVPDNNVTANAPGMTKGSGVGKYNIKPGQGTEMKINVSAKLPDGKTVSDSKTFRIKGIPAPVGTIRGEDGVVKGPKSSLLVSTVGAKLKDFDFEVGLNVTGFNIKVAGKPTVVVQGSKLNSQAQAILSAVSRGDQVTISEIKVSLAGAPGYLLPKTAPVIFEIQ